jgi:general secretion pathway protein G
MTGRFWNRRQLIVGTVQYRQVAFELVYMLAFIVVFFAVFFLPLIIKLQSDVLGDAERQVVADQFLDLHARGWPIILGMCLLFIMHSFIWSHRIAGPLYRFKQVFKTVTKGDLTVPVSLRAKDYLTEEAHDLGAMVTRLRQQIAAIKRDADRVADLTNDVTDIIDGSSTGARDQHIQNLQARVHSLQQRLGEFRTSTDTEEERISKRRQVETSPPGFTLVELAIVIVVLGALAVMAVPNYSRALEAARVARAIGDIQTIEKDIVSYEVEFDTTPPSLAAVGRGAMLDPWRRPYVYADFATVGTGGARKDRFLVPLNSTYDLYSVGRDGVSSPPMNAQNSRDDVVRANDGGFVGLAVNY